MSIFKVNNLNLFYNKGLKSEKQALFNLKLELKENAVTALIGPSGCGKSTFLRCLNRMNDLINNCVIDGEVIYKEKNIFAKDQNVMLLRSEVGMVFQKPNPFPMSIYDNICYGPRCSGVKDKDTLDKLVEESLKGAALWDEVKDRLTDSALGLSGGQQQRLCIARTIAMKPKVLLMDEPTSALDPIATVKVEELIRELKKEYTIIIVTHNMQQATRVSDYTAFFLLGKVIEMDETNKIFKSPQMKETNDYITGRFG